MPLQLFPGLIPSTTDHTVGQQPLWERKPHSPVGRESHRHSAAESPRWFWALFLALVVLRLWYVFHLRIDQDEWQHLHTIWCTVVGQLQYRDVFDNHMPLFHMLWRPLLQCLGERSDIVLVMRLSMVPLFSGSLLLTYVMARRLYPSSIAAWAALATGWCPVFLFTGTEFRPDQLWCLLWLSAVAVLVMRPLTKTSCLIAGLLLGGAFAVSLKTFLLLGSLLGAFAIIQIHQQEIPRFRHLLGRGAALVGGILIAPSLVVWWFASHHALAHFWEGVVGYNARLAEDTSPVRYTRLFLSVPAMVLVYHTARTVINRSAGSPETAVRRGFLMAAGACYLILLLCFWPILSNEDYLPCIPVLMPSLISWLSTWRPGMPSRFTPVSLFIALELLAALIIRPPAWQQCMPECAVLKQVLQVTDDRDSVMDPTGQSIFRTRPYYYILETISRNAIHKGTIPDTIAADMIRNQSCVAIDGPEYPDSVRDFLSRHYLSIGDLFIAGQIWRTDEDNPPDALRFDVVVPASYVLLCPHGEIENEPQKSVVILDGAPYDGARFLKAGSHVLTWEGKHSVLVLEWAKAYERGLRPFADELSADSPR